MSSGANTTILDASASVVPIDEALKNSVRSRVNARFREYPVLCDYFPLLLENGASVRGVRAHCNSCQGPITSGMFRGEVRKGPQDTYRVTAIGWCLDCDLLSPYLFHVVPVCDDGYGLQTLEPRGWYEAYGDRAVLGFEECGADIRERKNKKRRRRRPASNNS